MNYISKWCLLCGKDHQGFDKKNWWRMVRKDELGNFWVGQPSTGTLLIKDKVVIGSSEEIFLVRNILDETVVGWVCQPSWQRAENVVNISSLNTQEQGREPKDLLYSLELADMKKENEMLKTNIDSLETEISKIKLRLRLESSQQKTLFSNKVISTFTSPASIYRALGIKVDGDGEKIKTNLIETEFIKPIENMSERRLRTLLKSIDLPIQTVLGAFHNDKMGLLKLYAANSNNSSRSCAQRVLNLDILKEMPIVQDAVKSYNNATSSEEKTRILSFLSQQFQEKELNALDFDEPITRYKHNKARSHAKAFSAGGKNFTSRAIHRDRINIKAYEDALAFITNEENIQRVAFGTKDVLLSDGTKISVPNALRIELRNRMFKNYKKLHMDPEGSYCGISESKFYELSTIATPGGQQKTMAGLDNISQRYGNENFDLVRELIQNLLNINNEIAYIYQNLLNQINQLQDYLKYSFKKHLLKYSPVGWHCIGRAIGGVECDSICLECSKISIDADEATTCQFCHENSLWSNDCPASCGNHSAFCPECNLIDLVFLEIDGILDLSKKYLSATQFEDKNYLAKLYKKSVMKYIGHLVRSHIEEQNKIDRRENLTLDSVEITADFKMKWTMLLLKETQQEWFGKAGVTWHGMMVIYRYAADSLNDEYTVDYYHTLSDDKKEDGFFVASDLLIIAQEIRRIAPERISALLTTDAAGCYSGKYLALILPYISKWSGLRFLEHNLGEAGRNKSALDGNFGTCGEAVRNTVASGHGPANSAHTVANSLRLSSLSNTNVKVIELDRTKHIKLKPSAISQIPIRFMAHRRYEYDKETGDFIGIRFFKHQFFGLGKFFSKADVSKCFIKRPILFGVKIIDENGIATESASIESNSDSDSDSDSDESIELDSEVVGGELDERVREVVEDLEVVREDFEETFSSKPAQDQPAPPTGLKRPAGKEARNITLDQKRQKRLERRRKRVIRWDKKKAKISVEFDKLKAKKSDSDGFWCPNAYCNRFFQSKNWLERHVNLINQCPQSSIANFQRVNSKKSAGNGEWIAPRPFVKCEDLIKKLASEGIILGETSSLKVFVDKDDPDQQVFFEPSPLPRQSQASEAELVQPLSFPSPPPVGYAAKRRRVKGGGTTISTKMTKKQLDFLTWCYERGAKEKGDKLSPIVAASLMKIHGLPLGEIRFSNDKFWKANVPPSPTFRECELLDHWKIRPWFSGQKAAFNKKIEKARQCAVESITSVNIDEASSDDDDNSDDENE